VDATCRAATYFRFDAKTIAKKVGNFGFVVGEGELRGGNESKKDCAKEMEKSKEFVEEKQLTHEEFLLDKTGFPKFLLVCLMIRFVHWLVRKLSVWASLSYIKTVDGKEVRGIFHEHLGKSKKYLLSSLLFLQGFSIKLNPKRPAI
jgi:hypothetical protein